MSTRYEREVAAQAARRASLTPYDTGDRLEPIPWVKDGITGQELPRTPEPDDYGRVDFDAEDSSTVATLWIERQADGTYVLKGYTNEPLKVEIDDQS
jgi:hypothetical protein